MEASTILYREFSNFRDTIDAILKSYSVKEDCEIEIKAAIDNIYNHIDDYKLKIEEEKEELEDKLSEAEDEVEQLKTGIHLYPKTLAERNTIESFLTQLYPNYNQQHNYEIF